MLLRHFCKGRLDVALAGGADHQQLQPENTACLPDFFGCARVGRCCYQPSEVDRCTAVGCSLWPYRFGTNPFSNRKGNPEVFLRAKEARSLEHASGEGRNVLTGLRWSGTAYRPSLRVLGFLRWVSAAPCDRGSLGELHGKHFWRLRAARLCVFPVRLVWWVAFCEERLYGVTAALIAGRVAPGSRYRFVSNNPGNAGLDRGSGRLSSVCEPCCSAGFFRRVFCA
jgi:hypothetical protein